MLLNIDTSLEAAGFEKQKSRKLAQCILLAFAIALSPIKLLGYLIPLVLLFFLLVSLLSRSFHRRLLVAALAVAGVISFYYAKNSFAGYELKIVPALLAVLTYGSIIFVVVFPRCNLIYRSVYTERFEQLLYLVFKIETYVAVFQMIAFLLINGFSLDESTGDIIQGTINPVSFIVESVGFNNQVFSINYIFLIIYLIPWMFRNHKRHMLIVGGVVVLLASVLHVMVSFLLAVSVSFFLAGIIRFRRQIISVLLAFLFFILLLFSTQPKNFSLFSFYFDSISGLTSPKSLIVANTFLRLPDDYPDALICGLGPGQYTSRASLISSGRYFGDFENPMGGQLGDSRFSSKAFIDYVFDTWEAYATNVEEYGNSTMSRPFFRC